MILTWKLVSSGIYRMVSLIHLALQQGEPKVFFSFLFFILHIVSGLLVVFPARRLNVLHGSPTSCGDLGVSGEAKTGSGQYSFCGSLLVKTGTGQPRFEGGKLNNISQSEKS